MFMRFIKKISFACALFFTFVLICCAKEVKFSCEYYKPYDSLAGTKEFAILCDIYDDYSHQCYMEVDNSVATTDSNKESILNWTSSYIFKWKARDYVQENNTCPPYLVARDDTKVNGYKVYAAYDYASAEELRTKLGASSHHLAQLKGSASNTQVDQAIKYITEATTNMRETMDNYSLDSCMDEDHIITRISKCRSIIDAFQTRIHSYKTERDNIVSAGTLNTSDSLIIDFDSTYEEALIFLSDSQDELEIEQDKIDAEMSDVDSDTDSDDKRDPSLNINLSGLCGEAKVARTLKFLGILISLLKIFVPLLIIVLGSVDFAKAMIDGKGDDIPKKLPIVIKRFITGVIIFLIPSIIEFMFGVIDTFSTTVDQYKNCWVCILDPDDCVVDE